MNYSANTTFEQYLLLNKEQRYITNRLRKQQGLVPYHATTGVTSPRLGISNPSKGTPRPHMVGKFNSTKGVPRPNSWTVGPDAELHARHQPWHKARAQANFRGEIWDLNFEKWLELWGDLWPRRGRGSADYCMVLIDPEGGWCEGNVEVITRKQHLTRMAKNRIGTLRRAR